MIARASHKGRERGAALLMVLLLVATLAFIILGFAEAMKRSVTLSAGAAARGTLLWRVASLEVLAEEAVREAVKAEDDAAFTLEHPLFAAEIAAPMPDGTGIVRFADATRCFNLNSLAVGAGAGSAINEPAVREFIEIGSAIGLQASDAEKIAHVVADWIDDNDLQEIGGAEDGFYTSLPTPFRTGSTRIAAVSELRAMDGVTAELYGALKPYVCALPTAEASRVNINMLRLQDAPILVGLTGGAVSLITAEEIIANRPPGGWKSIAEFWSLRSLADAGIDETVRAQRTAVTSRYIEVRAKASISEFDIGVRLFFQSNPESGELTLISREIGAAS